MHQYGSAKQGDAEQGKPGPNSPILGEVARSIRSNPTTWLRARPADAPQNHVFRAADLARIREMMELMRRLVFPGFFDPGPIGEANLDEHVRGLLDRIAAMLTEEIQSVQRYRKGGDKSHACASGEDSCAPASQLVAAFFTRIGEVRRLLALDVQAAYDGDPAAEHTDEVILCYPGIDAIFAHRVAHELYVLGVPILPRVIAEQAHSRTGIDIHPGARIGESFFIDHGSGTVIGETSVIGRNVKIYQGVTLGARSFPKDERGRVIRGIKRHPTIGDRVNLYAGAVVLGGDTIIGDDCVIAGGVFVTSSVDPGHVVQQPRADLSLRRAGAKSSRIVVEPAERHADVAWLEGGSGI